MHGLAEGCEAVAPRAAHGQQVEERTMLGLGQIQGREYAVTRQGCVRANDGGSGEMKVEI